MEEDRLEWSDRRGDKRKEERRRGVELTTDEEIEEKEGKRREREKEG